MASTSEKEDIRVGSVKQLLSELFSQSLQKTFPDISPAELKPLLAVCANPKFGDYQCNNAMGLWSKVKGTGTPFKNPNSIGQAILKNLPPSPLVEKGSIAGPGFVNVVLGKEWTEKRLQNLLLHGIDTWAPYIRSPSSSPSSPSSLSNSNQIETAVVDFSSPNIAKEMHVGHLRSTIIGDCIARMIEFGGVKVLRRNHVGDWGTQFGMLIEYLFEKIPEAAISREGSGGAIQQSIGDLQAFYKSAKKKFDDDTEFKDRAQKAVVKLQGGDPVYRSAWKEICEISRKEFDAVYKRLNVEIEERGESFYNPFIPDVLALLVSKEMVTESDGAQCIFLDGIKVPLIVVKTDGGFNYATTDLTCLWYRINEERSDWVIYVTDVGQSLHFDMVFKAAKLAGWIGPPRESGETAGQKHVRLDHVGFGLVLGEDGKRFRTRSSEVVRLVDLLDEAVTRCAQGLKERGKEGDWSEDEINRASEALGYGAVKYADLRNNRLTDYTFDYDRMLDMKGNTAVYLLYAHARICSIIRKSGKETSDIIEAAKDNKLSLEHSSERALALDLVMFTEAVESAIDDLLPSAVCEYLYNLSGSFTTFYTNCQVINTEQEDSRLILCEATAVVMRKCFQLLGITPLYRL